MPPPGAAREQHTWFGPPHPPAAATPIAAEQEPSTGFTRLWTAFMSARIVMAVAILGMHLAVHSWARPMPLWVLGACLGYLVLTILVRVLARPRGPGRPFDAQWLYTVGADLVFFVSLQSQQSVGVNYTPLLALPVLNLLLSVATYFTAGRQAKNNDDSAAMARIVCERYLRNGCITGVFLNVINVYFMYSAITGTGFGFGF